MDVKLSVDNFRVPARFSKAWFVAHTDHFIISIGSSLAVTLVVNAITHHMATILHFAHVPERVIHFIGY